MKRNLYSGDSRSRSLVISTITGVALLLLAIAVFAVASQARSLSTQAEQSVQTVEDLRVASFAHGEIVIATRVAEVAPEQTAAISQSTDNSISALESMSASFDDMASEGIQTSFIDFEQAVLSQADLLNADVIDPAALAQADEQTEQTFVVLADLLRAEQLEAVSGLESDNDLLNLIATMSTFIVAFVVPSAALFVFQALRAAPREMRSLRLDQDRIARRSHSMATVVAEEAQELRAKIADDPAAVSIGTIEKSLRRFEHIGVTNGAPAAFRSEQVNINNTLVQAVDDLHASSHVDIQAPEHISATADEDQLKVVVAELLTNAFEHGESPVKVSAETTAEEIVVRVIDSGPGIEETPLNALLRESEYELRENAADGSYGYGLLASRRAVESMGGTLRYERQDDQTHLVASLPLGKALAQTPKNEFPRAA